MLVLLYTRIIMWLKYSVFMLQSAKCIYAPWLDNKVIIIIIIIMFQD